MVHAMTFEKCKQCQLPGCLVCIAWQLPAMTGMLLLASSQSRQQWAGDQTTRLVGKMDRVFVNRNLVIFL